MAAKNQHTVLELLKLFQRKSILIYFFKKALCIILIPFIIIVVLVFTSYISSHKASYTASITQYFKKHIYDVNAALETINRQYLSLVTNNHILLSITKENPSASSLEFQNNVRQSTNAMNNVLNTVNYINGICLYSAINDKLFISVGNNDFIGDAQFIDALKSFSDINYNILYFKSKVLLCYTIQKNTKLYGYLVFSIDFPQIIGQEQEYMDYTLDVYTDDNFVIYSNKQEHYYQSITELYNVQNVCNNPGVIIEKKQMIFFTEPLAYKGLHIFFSAPLNMFALNMQTMILAMLTLLTIIILSVFLAWYLASQFYKNIIFILEDFYPIDSDEPDMQSTVNEIALIRNGISRLITENTAVAQELTKQIIKLKQSQILFLQTQLNSHFLFNALNLANLQVISTLKADNGASKIITIISDLLRVALNTKNYMVSIKDEIEYIQKYVHIQEIRYKNNFDFIWDLDESAYDYLTLKLLLQPIIENAFEHGINELEDKKGVIAFVLKAEKDNIVFTVSDNGSGMSQKKLTALREQIDSDVYPTDGHIGLHNVKQRLNLIFKEFDLNIESTPDQGTTVHIVIPKLR